MIGLVSSLREWWRWRVRRSQLNIYGVAQFRTVGTVEAFERGLWRIRIDGDEGRPVYVDGGHSSAAGLHIGERVEVEPSSPYSTTMPMGHRNWIVVRKLGGAQP
jgi:hypothetical protein